MLERHEAVSGRWWASNRPSTPCLIQPTQLIPPMSWIVFYARFDARDFSEHCASVHETSALIPVPHCTRLPTSACTATYALLQRQLIVTFPCPDRWPLVTDDAIEIGNNLHCRTLTYPSFCRHQWRQCLCLFLSHISCPRSHLHTEQSRALIYMHLSKVFHYIYFPVTKNVAGLTTVFTVSQTLLLCIL